MFPQNVGKIDKTIRIILGLAIIAAGVYWQSWFGVLGVVLFITAAVGRCGAYLPFGISTCKLEKK